MLGKFARELPSSIVVMTDQNDTVVEQKVTAERDEDFVVFHIGMRINAFWKIHQWLPLLLLAPRMVRELVNDTESGLLESRTVVGPGIRQVGFVQYWESFDALHEYAHDQDQLHFPAWQDYYQNGTNEDTAVGIWHETYLVDPARSETVYNNVPPLGLAACDDTELTAATDELTTAGGRLQPRDRSDSSSS